METKYIDRLQDLADYKWTHKNKIFDMKFHGTGLIIVSILNHISEYGKEQLHNDILRISEKNLSELEIFGLKVVLNEKLKLTRKERNLLECHGDIYIARDKEGILYLYTKEPREQQYPDMWLTDDGIGLILSDDIFNFITWESGKAWGKAELMELEVME